MVLGNPNAEDTGFRFNSSGQFVEGLDVAGTFTVHLVVTDNNGLTSVNDAHVTLHVVPTGGLHVQLTWDTGSDDLDLHVLRNNGALCSSDDCHYANCTAGAGSELDWGGGGHDPHLDIDDTDGFGPENMEITAPVDGTRYTVSINARRAAGAVHATVSISLFGTLRVAEVRNLAQTGVEWAVADVLWSATPTIIPIDTFDETPSGSCLGIP